MLVCASHGNILGRWAGFLCRKSVRLPQDGEQRWTVAPERNEEMTPVRCPFGPRAHVLHTWGGMRGEDGRMCLDGDPRPPLFPFGLREFLLPTSLG